MIELPPIDFMWDEVLAHYTASKLRFNFRPKDKDIAFLYQELLKFRKSVADINREREERSLKTL